MVPLTSSFETGVFVYWTTSNILTVTQSHLLQRAEVRAAIGMPPLPVLPGVNAPQASLPATPFVPEVTFSKPPPPAAAAPPEEKFKLDVQSGVPVQAQKRSSAKTKGR